MHMLFGKDTDWDRLYRLAVPQSRAATVEHSLQEGSDFTVRARAGRLSALSVLHRKSMLYGAFVWRARGA